ncbi:SDR family oxidoreductase [Adhaeribacter sp. BT258]|uniref:SDR family oxidoreductase n=1 Tax=Adhaeribacter terrigena TaxID=2793070 RepID=A0ABS1C5G3_9BACT|nr:SDR family oxidoreductase [Adhaeribacter terrigena]MBK0404543.1 SDR family oxidoreductase [Adhaeribacter terrigena]
MQETILITGATGTVGNQVVNKLSNLNVKVRAGVHSIIKGENLKYPNVELCEIEFRKPESLKAAFTGVDRVFMITPMTDDQVEIGKLLIDAAKAAGVKHVVKLSAAGAEAENGIQLGRWHREVERYLEESGLNYTILRPASFMQNFVNFYGDSIRKANKIYLPLGHGKVSFIDARDIANVAGRVLTSDNFRNEALYITGPEALTGEEIAQSISEATGRQIEFVDVPEDAARQEMQQMNMPEWMVNALMELHQVCKAGQAATVTDTTEKVTGHKGYTFRDFCQHYADCL